MDKEFICRNIINILDVHHCREWEIFAGEDLEQVLPKYLRKLVEDVPQVEIDIIMDKNKQTIDKIAHNQPITITEYNHFMEDLKVFKRKHLIKKTGAI